MTDRAAVSSIDHQQQRGASWDIIDEAIETYDQWMLDDDYDSMAILRQVIEKMRERRRLYALGEEACAKEGGK